MTRFFLPAFFAFTSAGYVLSDDTGLAPLFALLAIGHGVDRVWGRG